MNLSCLSILVDANNLKLTLRKAFHIEVRICINRLRTSFSTETDQQNMVFTPKRR